MSQQAIPCMLIRGGSSKGVYFLASDLPSDTSHRNQVLLDVIGRDASQLDGIGGGVPLTSKVAVVSLSEHPDADVDYLFVQIVVGENRVDTKPNCGNMLAGVGPFALEAGLISAQEDETVVKVRMLNSDKICELILQTPNGDITYSGNTQIDGVSGTSAPIVCNYQELSGAICGSLLPTGNAIDFIDGIEVTCIDNGMPVVVVRAVDLNVSGYESPQDLDADEELKAKLESIRLQAGPKMKLGDVAHAAIPKMCLVSAPNNGGLINSRTFIPHKCHSAIGVLGAVSVATSCAVPNSVAADLVQQPIGELLSVEHPAGEFSITLELNTAGELPIVERVGVLRTARLISRGEVFVPA